MFPPPFSGWECAFALAFSWICSAGRASNTTQNCGQWTADALWLVDRRRRHQNRLKLDTDADGNLFFPNDPLYSLNGAGGVQAAVQDVSR